MKPLSDVRFNQIVDSILHKSDPPYGLSKESIEEIVGEQMIDYRIANEGLGYPYSEARYSDIEEWEYSNDDDFEDVVRESMADAT